MITRSLLIFALLSIAYVWLAPYAPAPRKGLQGGTQWEKNVMKQEEVVFGTNKYEVVVVGSSVSGTFHYLPSNWFNLSFASYSSIQGLEIICDSHMEPCVVVVETNNVNFGFTPFPAASGIGRLAKQRLEAFHTKNKPSLVGMRLLGNAMGVRSSATVSPKIEGDSDSITVPEKVFQNAVERRLRGMAFEIPQDELTSRMQRLKSAVDCLVERGFQITFVRVPESAQLVDAPQIIQVQDAFENTFPKFRYDWFSDSSNVTSYASNDAIHLTKESSYRFSLKLVEHVESRWLTRE